MSKGAMCGWRSIGRALDRREERAGRNFQSLEMVKNVEPTAVRIPQLLGGDAAKGQGLRHSIGLC